MINVVRIDDEAVIVARHDPGDVRVKDALQVLLGALQLGFEGAVISDYNAIMELLGLPPGPLVGEAVRHLRSILGDIRRITQADSAEIYGWAKNLQSPVGLVQEIERHHLEDLRIEGHDVTGLHRRSDGAPAADQAFGELALDQ